MNKLLVTGYGLLCLLWSAGAHSALERISDFSLLDAAGEFHQLSRYQHHKALVMMSYVEGCENMSGQLADYANVASQFTDSDIDFVLIDSMGRGRESTGQQTTGLPLLTDEGQLVSETLQILHAGEVLVLNPQRLSVFYRGSADVLLTTTLDKVIQDEVSDTVANPGNGCEIAYAARDAHASQPPDYASEVAPILIDKCSECHRQGGVGPFALDSYIMVLGWSPMIREVLLNKRMPPAQVDPYIGHSEDARYLSPENLQTLIHWIDGGAPRGDGEEDPLEQLETVERSPWVLGEPDFIVTGPAHEIPPTGVMDYLYDEVTLPFSEDRWLRAVQYRAGDPSVLHHLMTFVTAPEEDFWGAEREQESVSRRFVEGYAPGEPSATEFPPGTGVLIPAGHNLSMQFHYVTNGQATVDTTELGLYFGDQQELIETRVQAVSTRFLLPPNEPDFPLLAQHTFDEDVVVFGVRARMNSRGKRMKFAVHYPDGSKRDLFSVPAYNYGWQPHYLLTESVQIPAGSTVEVSGAFDNSISNPNNPDANKEVGFGLNSWDEMFTGYFSYYAAP